MDRRRRIRKGAAAAAAVLILGAFPAPAAEIAEAAEDAEVTETAEIADEKKSGADVVIALDTSGSMRSADPMLASVDGASLFAAMLPEEDAGVGLVTFSSEAREDLPLTGDREQILAALAERKEEGPDGFGGETNIGQALDLAVGMLEREADKAPERSRMIVFFTDGKIDLDNNGTEDPEEKENRQLALSAAERAADEGIVISCIGLDGSEEGPDAELLREISSAGGGGYLETSDVGTLPDAFQLLFAEHIDSSVKRLPDLDTAGDGEEAVFEIRIPDGSVLEADAVIVCTDPESEGEGLARAGDFGEEAPQLTLTDPSGNTILPGKDGSALLRSSGAWHVLKLSSPAPGIWKAGVRTDRPCRLLLSLVYNYEIDLEAAVSVSGKGGETGARVRAWFSHDGEPLTDPALYEQFTSMYVEATNADGNAAQYDMELLDSEFSCEVPLIPGEIMSLQVFADSGTIRRTSAVLQAAGEQEPAAAPEPAGIDARGGARTVKLTGLFADRLRGQADISELFDASEACGTLTYEVKADDPLAECADYAEEGGVLKLSGKRDGSLALTVTARDEASGAMAEQKLEIIVDSVLGSSLRLAGIAAGACAAALVLALFALAGRRRKGAGGGGLLCWRYEDEDPGQEAVFETGLEERRFGMDEVVAAPELDREELKKVRFGRTGGGITCRNASSSLRIADFEGRTRRRIRLPGDGAGFCLEAGEGGGAVRLIFTYRTGEAADTGEFA